MKRLSINVLVIFTAVVLLVIVCGCASIAQPSPDASNAANATADRILGAINSGNYHDYTANFSDTMISQVGENEFNSTRSSVQDLFGNYVSRSAPVSSIVQGYNVFIYNCTFTKGQVKFQLTMNVTNTSEVDGVFFRKP